MKIHTARTVSIKSLLGLAIFLSVYSCAISFACHEDVRAADGDDVMTLISSIVHVGDDNSAKFTVDIMFQNSGEDPTVLSSYDLVVGEMLPEAITATSGTAILETHYHESEGSVVEISLGNAILRPGMTFSIQVSYEVSHFMLLNAGSYDAVLPLFRDLSTAEGESVVLIYPESFGDVNYATASYDETDADGQTRLLFDDLEEVSRLYVSIGSSKYVNVLVERSFVNETDSYIKQDVLIPPEYSSQHFAITSISPIPDSARASDDGNYYLTYSVPAEGTLWVRIQGVLISEAPYPSEYELNAQERLHALDTDTDWWHISDEDVLADIETIASIETLEGKIDRIYDYTKTELILSSGFRQLHGSEFRKGASVALKTYKNASVEDFADVFVSLCRYADVPARVVAGYVYPYSIDESQLGIFHVWPQYWSDDYGWVSVDPAFEKYVSLPMREQVGINRIVVASDYDQSALGSFLDTSTEFTLTDQRVDLHSEIASDIDVSSRVSAGSTVQGELTLRNMGNTLISELALVQVDSEETEVEMGDFFYRELIVPGQELVIPLTISPFEWFEKGTRSIEVAASGQSPDGEVTDRSLVEFDVLPLAWVEPVTWGITIMAFGVFLWSVYSGAKIGTRMVRLVRGKVTHGSFSERIAS